MLVYAGLRPGEALGLERRHIRERTVLVEQAVSDGDLKIQKILSLAKRRAVAGTGLVQTRSVTPNRAGAVTSVWPSLGFANPALLAGSV